MTWRSWYPPFERGGLVASHAATMRARFGRWPRDFLVIVERHFHGRIPDHVSSLAARLRTDRPWERCRHGTSLLDSFCLECQA